MVLLPSSPFSLLDGSPLHSDHALLSTLFSLLSTFVFFPIITIRKRPAERISCFSWFIPSSMDARRDCRAGAPKRANHALLSTFFSLLSTFVFFPIITIRKRPAERISCFSWFIPSSMDARRDCRAGAPKRANHALLSTFFSLLSTFVFFPIITIRKRVLDPINEGHKVKWASQGVHDEQTTKKTGEIRQ